MSVKAFIGWNKYFASQKVKDQRIKELEGIINRAIDGIETLSALNDWQEGQMKRM